jgi:hypothetical protein
LYLLGILSANPKFHPTPFTASGFAFKSPIIYPQPYKVIFFIPQIMLLIAQIPNFSLSTNFQFFKANISYLNIMIPNSKSSNVSTTPLPEPLTIIPQVQNSETLSISYKLSFATLIRLSNLNIMKFQN